MSSPERGKMLGDSPNWAQMNDVSEWSDKIHAISITDIGGKLEDVLTVEKGGKTEKIGHARAHYGGGIFLRRVRN